MSSSLERARIFGFSTVVDIVGLEDTSAILRLAEADYKVGLARLQVVDYAGETVLVDDRPKYLDTYTSKSESESARYVLPSFVKGQPRERRAVMRINADETISFICDVGSQYTCVQNEVVVEDALYLAGLPDSKARLSFAATFDRASFAIGLEFEPVPITGISKGFEAKKTCMLATSHDTSLAYTLGYAVTIPGRRNPFLVARDSTKHTKKVDEHRENILETFTELKAEAEMRESEIKQLALTPLEPSHAKYSPLLRQALELRTGKVDEWLNWKSEKLTKIFVEPDKELQFAGTALGFYMDSIDFAFYKDAGKDLFTKYESKVIDRLAAFRRALLEL